MAQLASCPQCEHELLVPNESDGEAWAKCPKCRAFFQVKQAALREVPEILLVESDAQEIEAKSAPTIAYSSSQPTPDYPSNDRLESPELADPDTTILMDGPQASGDLEAAAQRIDEWFRSAKTLPDAAPVTAADVGQSSDEAENYLAKDNASLTDATIDISAGQHDEMGSDAEFELGEAIEPLQTPAAWDDPHHMDQLLADIDSPKADEVAAAEVPSIERATSKDQSQEIEHSPVDFAPAPSKRQAKPRRKRSPVRTFAMAAVAGVIGIVLGGYALLWISGPSGDILHVADYLPQAILPPSFKTGSEQVAINTRPQTVPAEVEPLDDTEIAADTPEETADDRAEMQASFTTEEPAAATAPAIGDRYSTSGNDAKSPATVEEPASLDAPIADALPDTAEPTEPIRIANAPSFTSDELRASFELAKSAQPGLITGNFTDSKQVAQAKGYSYSMLADLAQKVSFVEDGTQTNEAQPLQQETDELFRQTLADPHARGEVAVIFPKWMSSPNRKHGGVFFAAKPASQENKGSVVECRMQLDDGQAITVLAPAAERPLESSRPLAIVGWIVDRPAEQISGYTGSATQAIWASRLIPLE
jgi:hypothetical protein